MEANSFRHLINSHILRLRFTTFAKRCLATLFSLSQAFAKYYSIGKDYFGKIFHPKTIVSLGQAILNLVQVRLSLVQVVLNLARVILSLGQVILNLARVILNLGQVILNLGQAILNLGQAAICSKQTILSLKFAFNRNLPPVLSLGQANDRISIYKKTFYLTINDIKEHIKCFLNGKYILPFKLIKNRGAIFLSQ